MFMMPNLRQSLLVSMKILFALNDLVDLLSGQWTRRFSQVAQRVEWVVRVEQLVADGFQPSDRFATT